MAINKAIVIGNLGADPQVHALPSGESVVNLSLATNERFTDRNGEKQQRTEWHRIVAFGRLAETCGQFLSKGRQVNVEGRLTTREYEAKDGSGKRYTPKSSRGKSGFSVGAAMRQANGLQARFRSSVQYREGRASGFPATISKQEQQP